MNLPTPFVVTRSAWTTLLGLSLAGSAFAEELEVQTVGKGCCNGSVQFADGNFGPPPAPLNDAGPLPGGYPSYAPGAVAPSMLPPGTSLPMAANGPAYAGPGIATGNRFAVSPPPGTLGQTYHRRSTILADDKHPRTAAVEVHLPEEVDVSARGLKAKWTGKVWRLETAEPLIPGLPHIYAIKAERRNKAGEIVSTDVRWIRLIMGRVVEVEF